MSTASARGIGAAASLALAAATVVALPVPAAAAEAPYAAAGGSAYGSTASVGTLVRSGATANVSLCTTKVASSANDTARVDLGAVGRVGATTTRVDSTEAGGRRAAVSSSRTATTSLLGGLVSASSITSTATVSRDATGYRTNGSSVFAGLRIAGKAISATPRPNTTITIPGVATVLLNQQTSGSNVSQRTQGVTALRVTLLKDNRLRLPVGTVVVGVSSASLSTPVQRRPYGSAWGTEVNVANLAGSGRTAAVYLPCGGSGGATRTNKVASVTVPALASVGAVSTTAQSTDTASATTATTSARAAGISLLGGVVKVEAVKAQANARRTGSTVALTPTGTDVVGLRVNGRSVTVSARENSVIPIAGVGTLTLRSTVRTSSSITVDALRLKLDTARAGLPAGTVITVGHAGAGVNAR